MDESLHNISDSHVHAGLYSRKLLSSLPCIEPLITKLGLSMAVPDPLVNLVMKQDLDQDVREQFYLSPQFIACHKKVKNWTCQPDEVFSCGLRIVPLGEQNFFPPQLILTIIFKAIQFFTATFLTVPSPPLDCVLRKNGIQWMANNVEILLEVGSCVIVMGRSDVSSQLQCMDTFVKTVNMVLNVKGDHCGGILHKVEVLDPNALESQSVPPSNELLWCDASSAAMALRIGKRHINSTCKSKEFPVKKLDWLHRFSLQGKFCNFIHTVCIKMCFPLIDKLLPLNYDIVSDFPEEVTVRWQDIARELGLSELTILKIHVLHQGNPELCCEEAIKECLIGREVKMTWQSLIEALKKLHMDDLVDIIYENWGNV